ncbi:MAG: type III polyketide synthase [Acidobacteriota bacterium]|nr:type III polyketide synthase [Acidobacteriota bacterium]
MRIAGAGSAFPKHYYPQAVLLAALREYWRGQIENPRMLDQLHAHAGVDGRHLVLPLERYYDLKTFGEFNRIWIEAAQELGERAIRCAMSRAGLDLSQIGALFFVSVTGIASPSIDARLINRMKLPTNIRRTPIFGLGCVAGAAGVARAADYVRAYPDQVAVLLSVELCSLTLQREDLSLANLVSSGLFGDGAAAVVVAGADVPVRSGPEIIATASVFYPDTEEVMGWDISEKGFRIVLSREVPDVVREHLGPDVDALLAAHGFERAQVGSWVMHTGGPKVLEAAEESLGMKKGDIQASWDCLRRVGNLSSASVLCVLEDVMLNRRPQPGTLGVMAALGPGFCSEVVLLRW